MWAHQPATERDAKVWMDSSRVFERGYASVQRPVSVINREKAILTLSKRVHSNLENKKLNCVYLIVFTAT